MNNGRAKFNSQTITLKVASEKDLNPHARQTFANYNAKDTQLKADALTALFVSANPLRADYEFNEEDYEIISNMRKDAERIISEMKHFLKNKKIVQ